MQSVKVWRDIVVIPTYEIGEPEKYPIFLEKRVYQGSSGSVYPHAVIEKIYDEKIDKEWEVIYLENNYLKIMILPALGGRVQMAYDKVKERHFVYYNHVIKPALVGLTGPWISGGIEFNWPQHHRPSTYEPVDFSIKENEDGSKTVWVSEVERMFRTKGMAGFTLHPDKAYLEIKVQLYNRTPHPQTFLWWANPAVAVNDDYQSVFPPDVNAVFDHGKRDVSTFPIATGTYYKMDYSAGVDISRYKNIPVPTSYMAITSNYDFIGGYENDSKGGLLHVADHHVSPGKKQWTWGNGDFGHAWDRNLTDEDGSYIELMCGVYTDNQPDFSWLQPYEEKSFRQYFMPYNNVGVVKNATKDALLNLDFIDSRAVVKVYVTSDFPDCKIKLWNAEKAYLEDKFSLSPEKGYEQMVNIGNIEHHTLTIAVYDKGGKEVISWSPEKPELKPVPDPAKAAKEPEDISSNEQLYLQGLHLEQYRHATYDPVKYYKEALRRDPGDVRNNNALGLWLLRRGKFIESERYFRKAIETLTGRNPNPYDGEPYFNLGMALKFQNDFNGAYSAFFKSCWNAAWQDAGYFNLAQIDCRKGNSEKALENVERSLIRNWHNHKARHLKAALLRKSGQKDEALSFAEDSLKIDSFNFGALYEKYLLTLDKADLANFKELIRDNVHNYIEFSIDYAQAGLFEEAIQLLSEYLEGKVQVYPMIHYFIGWYNQQTGDSETALLHYKAATEMPSDYCFPNRLEEVMALNAAILANPVDSKARYYLGNFWYASRQYEPALNCWENSRNIDDKFSIVHRNLALIYYNKYDKKEEALEELTQAFELDKNARVLMELDQLYKKINKPVDERLKLLEEHLDLVEQRDDLYLERAALYNMKGEYQKALELIMKHQFHPWEGGEGKVPAQYLMSNIELAKLFIKEGKYKNAISHLEDALIYPENLGEGKLYGAQENDINYWLGCAYKGLDDIDTASDYWQKASEGLSDPGPAIFYNDQQADKIYYQGLALIKLGKVDEANSRFNKLIDYGQKHIFDDVKLDYFAVSLPDLLIWEDDLNTRNKIHCHYLIGLGKLGLGQIDQALHEINQVLENDLYHMGAQNHKQLVRDLTYLLGEIQKA
jgi:tetratricopeptide (TPR) repeat protein